MQSIEQLASYQRCTARIASHWHEFQVSRRERLREQARCGHAAERAVESIIEDLFTEVLDWSIGDLNHQVGYADILLSRLGIKHLIIETKRPGALAWNRPAVQKALDQACCYAAKQKVQCVAVSDGVMLYAADVSHGGPNDRVFCPLDDPEPQHALWWLSIDGIYRSRCEANDASLRLLPECAASETRAGLQSGDELLHPKYKLPAHCFAYVGDAAKTSTWHLPYLNVDCTPDVRRLPKAVGAILANYRGAHLNSVPEPDIPDVLVRLACAAAALGKLPDQCSAPAAAYVQLVAALEQLDRLSEIPR